MSAFEADRFNHSRTSPRRTKIIFCLVPAPASQLSEPANLTDYLSPASFPLGAGGKKLVASRSSGWPEPLPAHPFDGSALDGSTLALRNAPRQLLDRLRRKPGA